jgi:hypothetical protein
MENKKEWWQETLNTKKKLRVKSEEFRVEVIHLAVDLKQKTL